MQPFETPTHLSFLRQPYLAANEILSIVRNTEHHELFLVIQQWITEGIPQGFKMEPIIYEAMRKWLAAEIHRTVPGVTIQSKEINLTGSARTGYSLKPGPQFGRALTSNSDLDLFIVSESLFLECERTFQGWLNDFSSGQVSPQNPRQKEYWNSNKLDVPGNLKRGFIDSTRLPTLHRYPVATALGDLMYRLKCKLEATKNAPAIKKASVRMYKDWYSALRQIHLNISALKNQN